MPRANSNVFQAGLDHAAAFVLTAVSLALAGATALVGF